VDTQHNVCRLDHDVEPTAGSFSLGTASAPFCTTMLELGDRVDDDDDDDDDDSPTRAYE
jgi:hypothetical protein